jgi:hypothetical protein
LQKADSVRELEREGVGLECHLEKFSRLRVKEAQRRGALEAFWALRVMANELHSGDDAA